jgi:hypothetical protein
VSTSARVAFGAHLLAQVGEVAFFGVADEGIADCIVADQDALDPIAIAVRQDQAAQERFLKMAMAGLSVKSGSRRRITAR